MHPHTKNGHWPQCVKVNSPRRERRKLPWLLFVLLTFGGAFLCIFDRSGNWIKNLSERMAEEKQIKIILNMKRENDKRNPTEKKSLFIVVHHHSWVASQKRLFLLSLARQSPSATLILVNWIDQLHLLHISAIKIINIRLKSMTIHLKNLVSFQTLNFNNTIWKNIHYNKWSNPSRS